ncbi:baseplate J/gp47 family protein [Salmonella enterica]|nr:baseplate J/gp47 family protein [Salmonella enterica]ELB8084897.1 baseplate J/gp47 family protein [Salmonella enterica]ELJ1892610.1 baseplate J/gp47 family protein [Salmonella enterica]
MALVLPEPVFADTDPEKITRTLVERYEDLAGKKLYPAQDEMLLINLMAYQQSLVMNRIQDAASQNLVAFARHSGLDFLGELVGVHRLGAASARSPLTFSLNAPAPADTLIPAGTRVSANDSVVFATDEDTILNAGRMAITVPATCTVEGVVGNGWQPAQISNLMDDIGDGTLDFSVTNPLVSSGGAEQESDDHLRDRIMLAPESFSNAGSRGAYRFHAMSAHQDIVDVAVVRSRPGTVVLYPLLATGLPDQNLLDLVAGICSDEKVRPLTDTVMVKQPVKAAYSIAATLTFMEGQDSTVVLKNAVDAINAWIQQKSARLGQDIIPSQIVAALSVPGVYRVELKQPGERVLAAHEWAFCTGGVITPGGKAHD